MTANIIQPMPDLSPEQWDALMADIMANGVLVPVVKDQHGRILDGNNRAAIAEKLGIDYPVKVVEVADDDDAWDRAVSLNCARRHLNREQTRELIRAELLRRPDQSDRAISRRIGCSPTTVGAVRAELHAAAEAERQRKAEEDRRKALAITEQIRRDLDNLLGQTTLLSLYLHEQGDCWQTVGDSLERIFLADMSNLDTEKEIWEPVWREVYGPFFDGIRSTDCDRLDKEQPCTVCTDADRKWRQEHPEQVYRWVDPPEADADE